MTTGLRILLVSFILRGVVLAAFEPREIGARAGGVGGASVAALNDSWSSWHNPSGLSQLRIQTVSLFYSPAPFGLKELAFGALAYVHPTEVGCLAISASRFGFDLYKETTVALSYSNSYHQAVAFGLSLRYHRLDIDRYGSAVAIGLDAGILIVPLENLRVGFIISNLNAPTIGVTNERIPQVYAMGFSYTPVEKLAILVKVEKDLRFPTSVKAGVEYRLLDFLALRTGLVTMPSKVTAGMGVLRSHFSLDYAVQIHPELGVTHQFSVSLSFGFLKDR